MPANKRFQVFVSSTFLDLRRERQAVLQELLKMNCIPAGMELFPASSDEPLTYIKKEIDRSDYYLLLIGHRYGNVHAPTRKSFTQLEFEYAQSVGVPIAALLREAPAPEPDGRSMELSAFRALVSTGRTVAFWNSVDDVHRLAFSSISHEIENVPRPGWIRADGAVVPIARVPALADLNDNFSFQVLATGRYIGSRPQTVTATWRRMFQAFAGQARDFLAEESVSQRIAAPLAQPVVNAEGYVVHAEDIVRLRAHFEALGLVEILAGTNQFGHSGIWWKLTPAGLQQFLEDFAVPRTACTVT